ncbi:spermidine/putrescine ABC transporter permease [Streptococcus pneumoniae]|nr:spermidine/putrescine ABC transporter permease [Streptococcus pneumoniae]
MKKTSSKLFVVPYMLWIALFVLAPLVLIFGQSFFNIEGQFSLENYKSYFASQNLTYLKMSFNSVLYAGIVTFVTLLISYPTALFLTRLKHRQLWLMLIILPTWINLLLKAYAFIGIFGQNGSINQFLEFIGIGSQQLLFTDFSFIFVASYIELPFMILPIFNVLDDMDNNLINASYDLGATKWETFRHVIFPLSMNGVRSGVQSVFIPSLSLFMLTRLIGGHRVITLGTAIEQNFLTNFLAFLSAFIATIIGTFGAIYIYQSRKKYQEAFLSLNNILMVAPDVMIGASFLILFTKLKFSLGFLTVLSSHVAFSIPIVVLMVLPRLKEMNGDMIHAAYDLGASQFQMFKEIMLPYLTPSIIAGYFMAFTYSLDDFAVTFFVTGNGFSTLSVEIYSRARKGISLEINALSALVFLFSIILVVGYYFISREKEEQA